MLARARETLTVSPGSIAPFWLRFSELRVAPAAMMLGMTAPTLTTALAELLAELVSVEDEVATVTMLVVRPEFVAVAVIVKLAAVPGRSVPRLQVIKPDWFTQ